MAPERFRGIRQSALEAPTSDAFRFSISTAAPIKALLKAPEFRRGLRELAKRGLSFDTSVFHHQLADLSQVADDVPEATIVLGHMGIAFGLGLGVADRRAIFAEWRDGLEDLSKRPNVTCKIGGLGMPFWGFGFESRTDPIGYAELAKAWRPYVETAVSMFGPDRCMMESNYPPDGRSAGYVPIWNAYKSILKDCTASEKAAIFHDTAARTYRLESTRPTPGA